MGSRWCRRDGVGGVVQLLDKAADVPVVVQFSTRRSMSLMGRSSEVPQVLFLRLWMLL